jgi:hypothetical protein
MWSFVVRVNICTSTRHGVRRGKKIKKIFSGKDRENVLDENKGLTMDGRLFVMPST